MDFNILFNCCILDLIFNEHGELPIKTEIAENTENGNEGRLSFVNRERPTFVNLSQGKFTKKDIKEGIQMNYHNFFLCSRSDTCPN